MMRMVIRFALLLAAVGLAQFPKARSLWIPPVLRDDLTFYRRPSINQPCRRVRFPDPA